MKDDLGTVYLIHFERPYKGTQHYIGWTGLNMHDRLKRHKGERGACLLRACSQSGIDFHIVRAWQNKPFTFEQQLKKRKKARLFCPICNPEGYRKYYQEDEVDCSFEKGGKQEQVDLRCGEVGDGPDQRSA